MSKIDLRLSYKNILILKHSLEKRIEVETNIIKTLEGIGVDPDSSWNKKYQELKKENEELKKENEEHKRCLEALIIEMAEGGYRYNCGRESNIFGDKYLEKYKERFKKI